MSRKKTTSRPMFNKISAKLLIAQNYTFSVSLFSQSVKNTGIVLNDYLLSSLNGIRDRPFDSWGGYVFLVKNVCSVKMKNK